MSALNRLVFQLRTYRCNAVNRRFGPIVGFQSSRIMMNSPNSTTMPLPPAKGEASAGIALTKLSGHGDVEPVARNEPSPRVSDSPSTQACLTGAKAHRF